MNKLLVFIVLIVLIGGGAFAFYSNQDSSSLLPVNENPSAITNNQNQGIGGEDTQGQVSDQQTSDQSQARGYVDYSEENLAAATQNGGRAVIFFHANWCPDCRAAEKDILSKKSEIPDDLTILKADYDTEKDLKKKYGITYQHTFVQVDASGNEITKWNGGSLSEIIQRTQP